MANDGFGNSFGFRTKLVDAAGICMTRLSEEEGGGSGSGGTVGRDGMGMGGKEEEGEQGYCAWAPQRKGHFVGFVFLNLIEIVLIEL